MTFRSTRSHDRNGRSGCSSAMQKLISSTGSHESEISTIKDCTSAIEMQKINVMKEHRESEARSQAVDGEFRVLALESQISVERRKREIKQLHMLEDHQHEQEKEFATQLVKRRSVQLTSVSRSLHM